MKKNNALSKGNNFEWVLQRRIHPLVSLFLVAVLMSTLSSICLFFLLYCLPMPISLTLTLTLLLTVLLSSTRCGYFKSLYIHVFDPTIRIMVSFPFPRMISCLSLSGFVLSVCFCMSTSTLLSIGSSLFSSVAPYLGEDAKGKKEALDHRRDHKGDHKAHHGNEHAGHDGAEETECHRERQVHAI